MDTLRVVRVVLVCAQCLAIAGCSWAIGVMTQRYGTRPAATRGAILFLATAVLANMAVLCAAAVRAPWCCVMDPGLGCGLLAAVAAAAHP